MCIGYRQIALISLGWVLSESRYIVKPILVTLAPTSIVMTSRLLKSTLWVGEVRSLGIYHFSVVSVGCLNDQILCFLRLRISGIRSDCGSAGNQSHYLEVSLYGLLDVNSADNLYRDLLEPSNTIRFISRKAYSCFISKPVRSLVLSAQS